MAWSRRAFGYGTWVKFRQSLKNIKNLCCRDGKSSWAKPSSQPVNLPSALPLMKPLIKGVDHPYVVFQIQLLLVNWAKKGKFIKLLKTKNLQYFFFVYRRQRGSVVSVGDLNVEDPSSNHQLRLLEWICPRWSPRGKFTTLCKYRGVASICNRNGGFQITKSCFVSNTYRGEFTLRCERGVPVSLFSPPPSPAMPLK